MADFGGTLTASGVNCIIGYGLEGTYGSVEAEDWTGMVDELRVARLDNVYRHRGVRNVRTDTSLQTVATRYEVGLRGKVDSGWPFAMVGGSIDDTADPTITVLRGGSHTTPNTAYLPSFTVKRTFDDDSWNLSFLGTTFTSGTFSCDLDSPWMYDIQGVAQSQGTTAATGVTIPSTMLGSWNTTVSVDVDDTEWDAGVTMNGLRNISFTIENNNLVRNEFGTSSPVSIRQPKAGGADITLNLTRSTIDDDLWTQISDGGFNSFRAVTTNGTDTHTHTFNDCRSTSSEAVTTLDDETVETVALIVKDWTCGIADGLTYVKYGTA